VPLYGTSLTILLAAALETGGDINHLEIGRLDQLDHHSPAVTPQPPHRAVPRSAGRRRQQLPSPDLDIDTQISQIRQAKEAAIDQQDFELAAFLRAREKDLLTKSRKGQPPTY
jgi:UvrB/uvrC motif